jgi:hypothetical protein
LVEEARQSTLIHSLSYKSKKEEVTMGECNPPPPTYKVHFGGFWKDDKSREDNSWVPTRKFDNL